jgi:hypothetical protein
MLKLMLLGPNFKVKGAPADDAAANGWRNHLVRPLICGVVRLLREIPPGVTVDRFVYDPVGMLA